MRLVIGHLYADLMSVYGDRGNVIALAQRCAWRGIAAEVRPIGVEEAVDLRAFDVLVFGGGQDQDQLTVCDDLQAVKGAALRDAVADGLVMLAVCGGYQLLGYYFRLGSGEVLPGLGIIDAYTVAGRRRLIGNAVVRCAWAGSPAPTLVGFENHSGQTFLHSARPLGAVVLGGGNNGRDGGEGAVQLNVFGTYLHGPLLPKNPWFADHLLTLALRRRYGADAALPPLDDALEQRAHEAVRRRALRLGRQLTGVR
ncbi:MAG: glutamine amidotransferase [Chloroflexi bacterium]|nr:glutamine amidotransferase [Chloroflexota bacterium]